MTTTYSQMAVSRMKKILSVDCELQWNWWGRSGSDGTECQGGAEGVGELARKGTARETHLHFHLALDAGLVA